ncbi:MAG: response regulator [Gemmatimonadaceae bacterium]|nr:response regulator [Gemmatimonadaceae bacterium]
MPHILVIDDSSTIRKAIRQILNGLTHDVVEAADGAAALETVRQDHGLDAILCDIDMPVMDGLTFLSALREDSDLPQPPVIMCTTHNSFERISDALGRGANEYIMKPFTPEIIAEKLASVGIG